MPRSFLLVLFLVCHRSVSFLLVQTPESSPWRTTTRASTTSSSLHAAGKGFGKQQGNNNDDAPAKTYGAESQKAMSDMIDVEGAMKAFFEGRQEWTPVFCSLSNFEDCQAKDFLNYYDSNNMDLSSSPYRQLQAIPTGEDDKQVLSNFLDAMHQSLLAIPVTESKGDDDNDVHFMEEGRRMLAISRFHVQQRSSSDAFEDLFTICWSELLHLATEGQEHTGSIILAPDYSLADLRRFADMNLVRPLEWLGIRNDFEVVAMERESPAIRLLYKLNDMPETSEDFPDEE